MLRQSDFFSLRDDYNYATDSYSTTTSVQIGAARKVITDYGVEIPPALKNVQDAILKYSHSDQWVTGNADTIPALVAENSNPATRRNVLSDALPRAALDGDIAIVRSILSNKVDLERRGPYDSTALLLAAERGLPEMVSVLLKSGANPHAVDQVGRGASNLRSGQWQRRRCAHASRSWPESEREGICMVTPLSWPPPLPAIRSPSICCLEVGPT